MFRKKKNLDPFSVAELNKLRYKTPFLLIDPIRLEKKFNEFTTYLKGFDLHYAVKCNSDAGVLSRLSKLGSKFEIASHNELKLLQAVGVAPSKVMFSSPVKAPADIRATYKAGVDRFAADCFSELDKISKNAPGSKVLIRVAVSDLGSKLQLSQKFGAPPREVVELMQYAVSLGLTPFGLTFHVGSQSNDTNTWEFAIQTIGSLMGQLKEHDIKIQMVDLGGGFPAKYTEEVPELDEISVLINRSLKAHIPYEVQYSIEPGRGLIGEAGVIASTVISRTVRGNKNWLYLDIGAYNGLVETQSTQGSLVYPLQSSKDISKEGRNKIHFVVTGPSCDSLDTMFFNVKLAKNITLNDKVYIGTAGAYTTSYASNFNGFGPPKVYFVGE